MKEDIFDEIAKSIDSGNVELTERLTKRAVEAGFELMDIIDMALNSGMKGVSEKFACGEYFLPELLAAADAVKAGLAIIEPLLKEKGGKRKTVGRVVMGTVAGDIHDIGKSIVATYLTIAGFEVIDLGFDVPNEEFMKAVEELKPNIIGMSALLSVTRPHQQEIIELLKKRNIRNNVSVIIGGAVASQEYADRIGADAYGADAVEAVAIAKKLVGFKGD
jgi:5-methyltetrahydrofolate--homocysteine methyltransferase